MVEVEDIRRPRGQDDDLVPARAVLPDVCPEREGSLRDLADGNGLINFELASNETKSHLQKTNKPQTEL